MDTINAPIQGRAGNVLKFNKLMLEGKIICL
jgi:hypothetical protein